MVSIPQGIRAMQRRARERSCRRPTSRLSRPLAADPTAKRRQACTARRAPHPAAPCSASSGTRTVTGALNLAPPGGAPTTRHARPFPSAPSASTAEAVMAGSGPGPDALRKLRLTPGGITPEPSSSPGGPSSSPLASSVCVVAAAGALLPLRRNPARHLLRSLGHRCRCRNVSESCNAPSRELLPSADLSIVTPAGSGPHGELSSGLYSAESSAPGGALLVSSGTRTVTGALNLAPPGGDPTTRHARPFPSGAERIDGCGRDGRLLARSRCAQEAEADARRHHAAALFQPRRAFLQPAGVVGSRRRCGC